MSTDPSLDVFESPITANVWKVLIKDKDVLQMEQVAVVLEPMKLEVSIRVDVCVDNSRVKKVLVKPGDTIEGGSPLFICRKSDLKCPVADETTRKS